MRVLLPRVTTVREDVLGREMLGRYLDLDFIALCEAGGVDACGENGEFHTVVVDAPWIDTEIELKAGDVHAVAGGHVVSIDLSIV